MCSSDLEIVDESDAPLPPGTAGRLRCRGPGLGSAPSDDATRTELVRNGWHYPGEIARLDQERFLYVLGRESEVIIRAGAKIHPGEIEAVLLAHPGVAEAAVAGVRLPSDNEETIAAFVTAKSRLDLGDVLAHCRARLTSYKEIGRAHV